MTDTLKDKNKCPNHQMYDVSWGGKILKLCNIHANGLRVLGNVMGSPVEVVGNPNQDQCMGNNDLDDYKSGK